MANFLQAKQTKFGLYVTLYTAVVIAILGVGNFLAQRHNKSLDVTANKKYSLSDQTEKVVRELKADVKISYFDQTEQLTNPRGNARDLLDRYDNLSPKLSVLYVDPDRHPTTARSMGVRAYGATFIEANGKKEEARSATEEEVTGAIIRALKGSARSVCWSSGLGERDMEDSQRSGYSQLKELIERNTYKTMKVSLLEKAEVNKDCTVLMVSGPRRDLPEPAVTAVKNYVENGGRALFLMDPPIKLPNDETDENAALVKVLSDWGVTLQKNLVLDTSPIGQVFGLGPEMPLVASYDAHDIVRTMRETASAFPLVRSLEVKAPTKGSAEKLFSSGGTSVATSNLAAAQIKLGGNETKGPFALAAAGKVPTGKDKIEGRFVITGSSGWVSNNFLRFGGNRDLVMNMLNWLSSDEDLISIRPKEPEDRRLSLSASSMNRLAFLSLLFIPMCIIAAGVRVWWKRR